MRTKRKIIQEQRELIEQMELRLKQQASAIEQLEQVVTDYRGREKAVTDAMTEVAAVRARVTGEAQKQADEILTEANTARQSAESEAQEMISTAYQSARDIVKGADAERKQKLDQTEAAINTYAEILRQYNEMMKDQVKQAEENARQYAAYYRQLSVAVPELLGDTQGLADAADEDLTLGEIDDDPAKLMRNIYTIEHRDIPEAEVPDRTSAEEEELPAQDIPDEQTMPEDEHTLPEDEHTAPEETAAEPACDAAEPDAASADAADEDAMPPVVSDLVEDGEDEAAELDKLLDDIINAAE